MHKAEHPEIMLGLGLDQETAALVESAAGPGFRLRNLPPDASAWLQRRESEARVAWIPWEVWRGLPKNRRDECCAADGLRRILLLDESAEADGSPETEQVLAEGFLTAVSPPLTRSKVRDALLRMRELDAVSTALRRKTEEVMLERELLARKSSHLSFLNRVLAHAASSLDVPSILTKAKTDLRHLLPVTTLCAVFWTHAADNDGLNAEIILPGRLAPQPVEAWRKVLLAAVERLGGATVAQCRQFCLTPGRGWNSGRTPEDGRLFMLPLTAGGERFGCLALLSAADLRLARDQAQTLSSAVSHLALALHNALLFRQVKNRAEHDGLTGIANRRSFDERLRHEVLRHGRYGDPLSLILFDIDHFKDINDTLGHQAGDQVLREVAGQFRENFRATDFPARYGGEEFAVILPHTGREQAVLLAERIRDRIAGRTYAGKRGVHVSVSAGVASLGENGAAENLVLLADQSLYLAKNSGRNRVVMAKPNGASGSLEAPSASAPAPAPAPAEAPEDRRRPRLAAM